MRPTRRPMPWARATSTTTCGRRRATPTARAPDKTAVMNSEYTVQAARISNNAPRVRRRPGPRSMDEDQPNAARRWRRTPHRARTSAPRWRPPTQTGDILTYTLEGTECCFLRHRPGHRPADWDQGGAGRRDHGHVHRHGPGHGPGRCSPGGQCRLSEQRHGDGGNRRHRRERASGGSWGCDGDLQRGHRRH